MMTAALWVPLQGRGCEACEDKPLRGTTVSYLNLNVTVDAISLTSLGGTPLLSLLALVTIVTKIKTHPAFSGQQAPKPGFSFLIWVLETQVTVSGSQHNSPARGPTLLAQTLQSPPTRPSMELVTHSGHHTIFAWSALTDDMAGDMGLIPGQGTKIPHALGQLSPYTATRESLCTASTESVLPKENPYTATGESLCTTVKIQYRQNKI
ncbi:hypothetical protein MJT46_000121 [Ovis ammon polii x Ovis aries]|nr:hypothetical protein MJT46_000121 [Ovis ammon polii x Ovis aries]